MPNGEEPDYDALEQFFAPVAEAIESFGEQHGLKLAKYYHGGSSWNLQFIHPRNGVGKIDVRRASARGVQVHGVWWWDDYDGQKRHLRSETEPPCPTLPDEVRRALEKMLCRMLSWEEWTEVVSGYTGWASTPRAEFEALGRAGLGLPR